MENRAYSNSEARRDTYYKAFISKGVHVLHDPSTKKWLDDAINQTETYSFILAMRNASLEILLSTPTLGHDQIIRASNQVLKDLHLSDNRFYCLGAGAIEFDERNTFSIFMLNNSPLEKLIKEDIEKYPQYKDSQLTLDTAERMFEEVLQPS